MRRKKKATTPTPEKRAQQEPDCRKEQLEAELASHKPGATGFSARSSRPRC